MRAAGAGGASTRRAAALRPSIEVVDDGDDLLLLSPTTGIDLVVRDVAPEARALVHVLAGGGGTCETLRRRLAARGHPVAPDDLEDGLARLASAGVLCDATVDGEAHLTADQRSRYDRQLHFFADVSDEPRERIQARLLAATVVCLGVGGLGTWTAAALALAGVGRLVLVDDDVVEPSNLNRQILFTLDDLGAPKVDVAAAALRGRNPDVDVVTHRRRVTGEDDVADLARGADLVVATADAPADRIAGWVERGCARAGVAHISAGQFPPRVRVGPLIVPGGDRPEPAAEDDFAAALMRRRAEHGPDIAATVAAPSAVVGGLLADEAMKWLGGWQEPATLGRAMVLDLRAMSVEWEPAVAGAGACR